MRICLFACPSPWIFPDRITRDAAMRTVLQDGDLREGGLRNRNRTRIYLKYVHKPYVFPNRNMASFDQQPPPPPENDEQREERGLMEIAKSLAQQGEEET